MFVALAAQRMLVQKRGAPRAPAIRAVERTDAVLAALTLVTPTNRAVDRWTNGHDGDLDEANDDGGGNDNAREGSSPSRPLLSRA
jgi:hypothetical protein